MNALVRLVTFALIGWLAVPPAAVSADKQDLKPAEWKVLTLYKVLPYIEWPDTAFAGANNKLVIGILGADPFDGLLDELAKGNPVKGREVIVRKFDDPAEAAKCNVVFVSAAQLANWQAAVKALDMTGKLVVGETKDFARGDGNLNLVFEKRRMQMNKDRIDAAKKAGLMTVDSKLLGSGLVDFVKEKEKDK